MTYSCNFKYNTNILLPPVNIDIRTPTVVVMSAPIKGYRIYDRVYNFSGKSLQETNPIANLKDIKFTTFYLTHKSGTSVSVKFVAVEKSVPSGQSVRSVGSLGNKTCFRPKMNEFTAIHIIDPSPLKIPPIAP